MYKSKIEGILKQMGADISYLGYHYCTYAVDLIIDDPERVVYISKNLYPEIAKRYRTTAACVERDIRTIIKYIFDHGDRGLLETVMVGRVNEKPRNAQFLAALAEYIKSEYCILVR